MNNHADLGASIVDSFRLVSAVATECEAMLKIAKEEVSRMLLEPEIKQTYAAAGEWLLSYQEDDSGWLNTELAASLALKQRRKRTPSGHVFVQISLMGYGIDASDNLEPLIHVGWWHDPIVFGESQMGFPIENGTDYQLELEEGVLFRWTHKAAANEWCYTLRLTDVNTLQDVANLIVAPLKRLLLGHSVSDVLGRLPVVGFIARQSDSELHQFSVTPR
jgi:hypothetical protein